MERKPLEDYLNQPYPFEVIASEDGGYVIRFPDLPGCITQTETVEEIGPLAEDARRVWIESAYRDGQPIPEPTTEVSYSGRFIVRIPRILHRELAQQAKAEGVSLNQYVGTLLAAAAARPFGFGNPVGSPAEAGARR
jgi:predicted RNase H-like HicB family nuclease